MCSRIVIVAAVPATALVPFASAWCEGASPAPVQEPQRQLAGGYRVTGGGPGGGGKYNGEVEIKKTGETYQLAWIIGQSRYAGTGFVSGSTLSVIFVPSQGRPGVAVYEIGRDGTLSGRYTTLGASSVAPEILEPLDRF